MGVRDKVEVTMEARVEVRVEVKVGVGVGVQVRLCVMLFCGGIVVVSSSPV